MKAADSDTIASVDFAVDYASPLGRHTDIYHAENVNFWRDIIPEIVRDQIRSAEIEKPVRLHVRPGEGMPVYRRQHHLKIKRSQFGRHIAYGRALRPFYGRYYPKGLLKGVAGIFPQNIQPFRCLKVDDKTIEAELNHPLVDKQIQLQANVLQRGVKLEERGGASIDWIETIMNGSGMQARINGKPTAFFDENPFKRNDEKPDSEFYRQPRFVQHIDAKADEIITSLHGRLLDPQMKVLDLMTSWVSHLPLDLQLEEAHGLGMNRAELAANPMLTAYMVHDLNLKPFLPYPDSRFDAVLCSASVEYLIRPFEIFKEVARVLRSEGLFITTFSNRWFPPKAVNIWQQIHEFERMGLVMEYFAGSGEFTQLETLSVRGFPRPYEDKYFPQLRYADPVYAVWGRKKSL